MAQASKSNRASYINKLNIKAIKLGCQLEGCNKGKQDKEVGVVEETARWIRVVYTMD